LPSRVLNIGEKEFGDEKKMHWEGVFKIGNLSGIPYLSKIANCHPVEFAGRLKIPVLIITAAKEELLNNRDHGRKGYRIVKDNVPAEYNLFPGTHFEICRRGRLAEIHRAIEWFDKHFKP
jgi:hypothetical protein